MSESYSDSCADGHRDPVASKNSTVNGLFLLPQSYASPQLFPVQLYNVLEAAPIVGFEDIVSWLPTGDGFRIHDRNRFETYIIPRFFSSQSKYKSFTRQLNLYKFKRMSTVKMDRGCYHKDNFIRGKPELCRSILRISTSKKQ
jgi:hypothetical protein